MINELAVLFLSAREKAAGIVRTLGDEIQKCSPLNKDHHPAWCPTCDGMEDAYNMAEERIRAMEVDKP